MSRGARSARIRHLGLAGACSVLLQAPPVAAQNAETPDSAPDGAAQSFEPVSPTVEQCIEFHERAQVLRIDGRLIESRTALGACAQDACPDPLKQDCVTWREEVSQQVPTVIFEAITNAGAAGTGVVSVDDRELTRTLDGRSLELDPGHYHFRFELPDGSKRVVSAMIKPGGKNVVVSADFRTVPSPSPPPPEPSPAPAPLPSTPPPTTYERPRPRVVPTGTYVLGALTVASTGVAIGLGVTTNTKEENSREDCAPRCSQARVDEITTLALLTDISIGVAVGSAIGASLFYAYSEDEPVGAVAVHPSLFYAPGGATYGGLWGSF